MARNRNNKTEKKSFGRSNRKSRVLVISGHPLVRWAISQLIPPELEVCAEEADPSSALRAMRSTRPDLAILDLLFSIGDGIDFLKIVKQRHPQLPVLVVSAYDDVMYAEWAVRAGARGYLVREECREHLVPAIRAILNGKIYLSEQLSSILVDKLISGKSGDTKTILSGLSGREIEIFEMIGQGGLQSRQMAEKLHLSVKTIQAYKENIKTKLGLRDTGQLIRYAVMFTIAPDRLH